MINNHVLSLPFLRSLSRFQTFFSEFYLLNVISKLFGIELRDPEISGELRAEILKEIFHSFLWDAKNIKDGIYKEDKEKFEFLDIKHWKNLALVLKDYPTVIQRRKKFSHKIKSKDYPSYFERSFHFQTDGYTSEHSARLYEHQVEILFNGTANLMRKMIIKSLKSHLSEFNFSVLEIACGTGIGSRIVANHFEKAQVLGTDLSREYIKYAQNCEDNQFPNIKFQTEDATSLSFDDESFDVTFQIFLLHELPNDQREKAIEEQVRVTKKGGLILIVESLQASDRPHWMPIFRSFPKNYHEPYFMNYIKNDIEPIMKKFPVSIVEVEKRLFSKCLTFKRL